MSALLRQEIVDLVPARKGHFRLESGHHGDLWLDLELLCLHPEPVRRLVSELAKRLARYECAAVCAPLVEGAFVALMVASESDCRILATPARPCSWTPLSPRFATIGARK